MPRGKKSNPAEPSPAAIRKANLAALEDAYRAEPGIIGDLFRQALDFDAEIRAIYEKRNDNRDSLRKMAKLGHVNIADVELIYPTPTEKPTPATTDVPETPAETVAA